jgi:hypothetical protein
MLKIAQCMRAHGVTNLPDPNANGAFTQPVGNPSPWYAAAAKACGGPPVP